MKKRIVALALILAISILTFAGCNTGTPGNSSNGSISSVDNGEDAGLRKYASPVTLTTFLSSSDTLERDLAMTESGETIEKNRFTKWFEETLNIKLSYLWVAKGDAYATKLNLAISSGQIPDVFQVSATQAQQLYKAGKIQPLTALYKTYATETTKTYMNSDPAKDDVFGAATFNGELYGIPKMWSSYDTAEYLWVRTDWLKKYSLPEPTSMQNVITIAERLAGEDPDGNGKKDSIGLGFVSTINSATGGMIGFFNGYHAYMDYFMKQDGKLVFSDFLPEMKTALSSLASLYKNGAISKEYSTTDKEKLEEYIVSGKIGMFYGQHWMPLNPLQDCVQLDDTAVWKAYPLPSADDTPASTQLYAGTTSWWVVSKECKNPEAIIKLVNLTCTNESDAPDYVTKQDVTNYYEFNPVLVQDPMVNIKQMEGFRSYRKGEKTDVSKAGLAIKIKQYESYKAGNENYWWVDQIYGIDGCPIETLRDVYIKQNRTVMSDFHGVSTNTMVKSGSTLDKLISQAFVEIITGSKNISEFDTLKKRWLTLGGQNILDEVNVSK